MSLRRLYQSIQTQARICTYCQNPILRNIDQDQHGRLCHHGCLNIALDTHYECVECFSNFDGTEACLEETQTTWGDDFKTSHTVWCPNCGSSNVKGLTQKGVIEI